MRVSVRVTMASDDTLQQRLDAYVAGKCSSRSLSEELLAHCAAVPRASWEALALLDQYQRRGKLPRDLQRSISQSIERRALGVTASESASVGRYVGVTQLEAANQAPIIQAPAIQAPAIQAPIIQAPIIQAPIIQAPLNVVVRRQSAWHWPVRSVQLMAVVVFVLAVGASQGLGERENAVAPGAAPPAARVAVPGRLTLAADTFIVQPDGHSAVISVARLDGTDGPVSFRWWTQGAGAKAGADYRGRAATRVDMSPGTNAVQLTVPILKNRARRHTELFYVAIGDPQGGARLGDTRRAAVFILPR